jgi:electron transfer flavoprotein alpha subunit
VLAINPDPDAPIWEHADTGIVADWRDAVPLLVAELRARTV